MVEVRHLILGAGLDYNGNPMDTYLGTDVIVKSQLVVFRLVMKNMFTVVQIQLL